jgi:hypothetical protein
MNKTVIEVKSALWQKIFISLLALFFTVVGIVCWASPFFPVFQGPPPDLWEAAIMGLCFVALGFGIWWPVMRYSICADETGISQTNGYFHQSARWSDVAYYYMEPNRRFHKSSHLYIEPVMFNAKSQVIFHGYEHILVSTTKIFDQRNNLWRFVEEQLQGKKIDPPSPDLDPKILAWRSLEVNWSEKSWLWITGRIIALILYAVFWFCMWMLPVFYVATHNWVTPKYWEPLFILPMTISPFLPRIIWLEIKKRKFAKELKLRENAKQTAAAERSQKYF